MGVHKKILTEEERNVFLVKFRGIIDIFEDSTLTEDEKVRLFLSIYPTIKSFEKEYNYYFYMCGEYEGLSNDKVMLYNENNMISNLKYIMKIDDLLINYNYAEYIIKAYLTMHNSHIDNFFFNDMNVSEEIFNYCVKIVKQLNPNLYHEYELKKVENIKKRYDERINSLKEIANGIKTGKLSDGTSFDILQFWKLVPFKYFHGLQMELHEYKKYVNPAISQLPTSSFYHDIRNFITVALPEEKDTILKYMCKHEAFSFNYITLNEMIDNQRTVISQQREMPTGELVDIDFGIDDIINIFKYINYHKLPSLTQVYSEVKERYINGEDISVPENVEKIETTPLVLDENLEQQKENIRVLIKSTKRV